MPAEYDLNELERLEKAATGPEWRCKTNTGHWPLVIRKQEGKCAFLAAGGIGQANADASLAVALRNAAPAMLRDLRELEARRKGEWKDLGADNAALSSLREAFEAGPEMGRAKMALFLRAERDELRELAGRMADKMSEGQWEQDKVTGEDVCSWCGDVRDITTGSDTCHCSWGQDINDARQHGHGHALGPQGR